MRHLGGHPLAREDSWRKLLCGHALWSLLGFGYWAVERRDGGAMIGQVGFADFQRDMAPSIMGIPEMGWLFAGEAAGQGYATEAAAAGLAWIDEALSPPETSRSSTSTTRRRSGSPRNAASPRAKPRGLSRRIDPAAQAAERGAPPLSGRAGRLREGRGGQQEATQRNDIHFHFKPSARYR